MRQWTILVGLAAISLLGPASAGHAQVGVHIGINLPDPPSLVIIAGTPVAYAPAVSANYFFYGGQNHVFSRHGRYSWAAHHRPPGGVSPGSLPAPPPSAPV